ncbi:MAG: phage major capsid protein [Alphaproteobacteria bacterium]|nr:phage major capsid protein [Alphaproteobacteria bacterium]
MTDEKKIVDHIQALDTECRALTDEMGQAATTKERAAEIEARFDAAMAERDRLSADLSKMRRPPYADVTGGEDDGGSAGGGVWERGAAPPFGLAPEQRMLDWAAKHQPDPYRGLSAGAYLRSMILGGKTETERRALAEGSDSAGGYSVPAVVSAELLDNLRAASVTVQAGARTVPLTSATNSIAAVASDPAPAWRSENAAVAESDPTFRAVVFTPRSLAVLVKVSRELIEDSLNLETALPQLLAAALATELDRVALLGSGTAPEPRGIANTSGIGTAALGADLANYGPLLAGRTAILTANAGPVTAAILHPRDEGTLAGLTDSTGQPLMAPAALSAIPQLTTTAVPTDGGTGSDESTIFAGNFQHLMIGMRTGLRVELLRETYAANHQYAFVASLRADVAVAHPGAFYTVTAVTG